MITDERRDEIEGMAETQQWARDADAADAMKELLEDNRVLVRRLEEAYQAWNRDVRRMKYEVTSWKRIVERLALGLDDMEEIDRLVAVTMEQASNHPKGEAVPMYADTIIRILDAFRRLRISERELLLKLENCEKERDAVVGEVKGGS